MKFFLDKSCRENKKKHILCSIYIFFENHVVYEKMWKNVVERGRTQVTIWRMRIECWIPKATNTHRLGNTCCCNKGCTNASQCYVTQDCLSCIFIVQITIHHKSGSFIQKWAYSCNLYIFSDLCL